MHSKCQGEKATYHLFFSENEHQTKPRKERKEKQLLLSKPGIYSLIKDKAGCNYIHQLGENSISCEQKPGWDFLTKITYIIFRWTHWGYVLEKNKIISRSTCETLFPSDFLLQITSVKIELMINYNFLRQLKCKLCQHNKLILWIHKYSFFSFISLF